MTIWSIWEEISRIMAVLCLITAFAAVTAAGILLMREELIDRLRSAAGSGSRRKTGALLLAAVCIWIIVIGKSVSAAEVPGDGSRTGGSESAGAGSASSACGSTGAESAGIGSREAESSEIGGTAESSPEAGSTGKSSGNAGEGITEPAVSREWAAEIEPGTETEDPAVPQDEPGTIPDIPESEEKVQPDQKAPAIYIETAQEVAADKDGTVYCRADNGGIRVRFTEEQENDTGIISCSVVMTDCNGKELRKEGVQEEGAGETEREEGESAAQAAMNIEIKPEETATLADGAILVTAEAEDAAGNSGTGEFRFVLDTVSPVLSTDINLPAGNPAGIDAEHSIVYYGGDPGQYGGAAPEISVLFRVTDQNADPERLEVRTANAAVPAGQCCEQVYPGWESAALEECEILPQKAGDDSSENSEGSVEENSEGSAEENSGDSSGVNSTEGSSEALPGEILLQLKRFPGTEKTPDGVYRFGIAGTDKAGNPLVIGKAAENGLQDLFCEDADKGAFMTGRKVVDTKAPQGEIRIMSPDGDIYCRMSARGGAWTMEQEDFMPFRGEQDAVIEYSAKDPSPVSASGKLLSTAGEENGEMPDAGRFIPGCGGRVSVCGGQVFRIEDFVLRDRAGNESAVMRRTVNFYLDTRMPDVDLDAPYAAVRAVPEITARSADGRPLYSGPVTLEITAVDPDRIHGGSGLREVFCSVKVNGETLMEETLFRGEDMPEDPEYQFRGDITVPSSGQWESNDIEVTVIAADNAGNESDPCCGGICRFGIDVTGPAVNVSYDNNEVRNGRYFGGTRTAVIAARERNFDGNKLKVTTNGAASGEWKRRGGSDIWTMEVNFDADGAYTLEVDGSDALGNPAAVSFTGEAPEAFTIDRIPPLVEVFWDNGDVRNGRYYSAPRCATVRITELSLDERAVKILPFSRSLHKVAEVSDDRTEGEVPVYEAEVPFTEEGEWALNCICMDLAGNAASPVYEDSFIIDMTAPKLYFDGETVQEMGSCGTGISPVLRCEEENPAPGSLYAVWSNVTAGGCAAECRGSETGEVVLPDLPEERAQDGICVLFGTACDLAGNRAMVRRNLCVNRFGSLYDVSEDEGTAEMIGGSFAEAGTPFVISEYNLSPLTGRQITLFRNGNARVLNEGKDYSVEEERNRTGIKYTYTVDPEAYREEGKYSLLLESEDESGNYSRSPGRFRAGAEYSPSWTVDRTPPTVRIAGTEAGRNTFVADSVQVRLVPSDNMELGSLAVEIADDRGNILESQRIGQEELRTIMERNGGEVPVEIRANGQWQTLKAEAVDVAGNRSGGILGIADGEEKAGNSEEAADGYRVLVSSNLMVHLYRSGILPAVAFLAFILAIRYVYSVYKHTLA